MQTSELLVFVQGGRSNVCREHTQQRKQLSTEKETIRSERDPWRLKKKNNNNNNNNFRDTKVIFLQSLTAGPRSFLKGEQALFVLVEPLESRSLMDRVPRHGS